MGEVIGNISAIVLVIVALTIALKVIFFVLGLFGLFGLLVKLAIFGGLIYLGWTIFCKVFKRKEAF